MNSQQWNNAIIADRVRLLKALSQMKNDFPESDINTGTLGLSNSQLYELLNRNMYLYRNAKRNISTNELINLANQ